MLCPTTGEVAEEKGITRDGDDGPNEVECKFRKSQPILRARQRFMFCSPTPADYVGESISREPEKSLKNDKTDGRLGLPANLGFPVKNLFAAARSSQISPKFRVWCCRSFCDSISSISCGFSGNRCCLLTHERGYCSDQDCVHGVMVLCAMPLKFFMECMLIHDTWSKSR